MPIEQILNYFDKNFHGKIVGLNIPNINDITLDEACSIVIRQNKSVGFPPTRFENTVNRGIYENNLKEKIRNLVLDIELTQYLEEVINKYLDRGYILTIEDIIRKRADHFGFDDNIIRQAIARSERFDQIRTE